MSSTQKCGLLLSTHSGRSTPKRTKKIYGCRIHITHWRYTDLVVPGFEKPLSVAHHLVRTRICPEPVRLAVVRSRPKKSKPYRYFLVYTTDLSLSVESLVRYGFVA